MPVNPTTPRKNECDPPCQNLIDCQAQVNHLTSELRDKMVRLSSMEVTMNPQDLTAIQKAQERLLQLIDGDLSRDMPGMRRQLEELSNQVIIYNEERQKLRWVLV